MKAAQLFDSIKQFSRGTDRPILNDAQLAAALDVAPPVVSHIRAGNLKIGSRMIICIHEFTGWTIRDIKAALDMSCLASLAPN